MAKKVPRLETLSHTFLGWEGSPTKKKGTHILTSILEDLDGNHLLWFRRKTKRRTEAILGGSNLNLVAPSRPLSFLAF